MSNIVNITVNGKPTTAKVGTLLSDILDIEKPCGGHGTCGKCKVKVNGRDQLACKYIVESDIEVETYKKAEIVSSTGAIESGVLTSNLCFALDIGTTTLALALVSRDEKRIVRVVTATNPQRSFGADVISRIEYCRDNGVEALKSSVVGAVNKMIDGIFAEFGNLPIEKMYVAGNTTMLHCFLGVDCSSMGASPYTPSFIEMRAERGCDVGIDRVGEIVTLPGVSAFVGADIVAGVNYVDMPKDDKYSLLIDLGTNAEIILFSKENLICTAAAAGPCFEGVNISCGMSAAEGAVSAYFADKSYETIGNQKAKGICATGLVDIIAESVKNETVDETGYMEDDLVIAEGVCLTPKDVREFQLAKSAVLSATECLLEKVGIGVADLERLYVAGGFSAALKVENAVYTGLLPKGAEKIFTPVNNSSLLGCVKYALEEKKLDFVEKTKYIDVSADGSFSEKFFENMCFEV